MNLFGFVSLAVMRKDVLVISWQRNRKINVVTGVPHTVNLNSVHIAGGEQVLLGEIIRIENASNHEYYLLLNA